MAVAHYAYVGSFDFNQTDKGLAAFVYDPRAGAFTQIGRYVTDMNLGQQTYDARRGVLFAVDEDKRLRARDDGGGRLVSFRLDARTGALETIGIRSAASALPSCICLDAAGRYAVVTHFCKPGHVTKLVPRPGGGFARRVEFDDAVVALHTVAADGTIGPLCDAAYQTGTGVPGPQVMSHLHCAVRSPDGRLFLVCDTGADRIAAYGVDAAAGRLVPKGHTAMQPGCGTRYGVFHPQKPWFFCNNENRAVVHAFRYDSASGALAEICAASLCGVEAPGGQSPMVSDICLHPNGNHLYVAARTANKIAMLDILPGGNLRARQWIHCGGEGPRGLCASPDGRFLFVANRCSNSVDALAVGADGRLSPAGRRATVNCPANLQIIAVGA